MRSAADCLQRVESHTMPGTNDYIVTPDKRLERRKVEIL
jgi:hypothetical protein